MAGTVISYPLNGASNWENFTDIVQKIQAGFMRVSLSNFGNDSEPQVESGSLLDVNGSVCQFTVNESITGWSGISAGNDVYIYVTVTGSSVTVSFSTTAPTYSAAKRGYYNGNDRCIGGLFKVSATKYSQKWLYPANGQQKIKDGSVKPIGLTFDGSPAEEAFYGPAVTLNDPVSKGQPILFLHNRYGSGSNYVAKQASNILSPLDASCYGHHCVYLGDDLYAHAILEVGATYYLRLRFYEHNWGSATWTQRGTTQVVWSGSSDFRNIIGIYYLGDVSGQAQVGILVRPDTSLGLIMYTYQFNKSTYAVSQLGSTDTIASGVNTSVLYSATHAFKDVWQRFWIFYCDQVSPGNVYFKVFDHDGDGTYTQVATLTVLASSGNVRLYGGQAHPIKLSSTKYRWILSGTAYYPVSPAIGLIAIDFEDATDTLSEAFELYYDVEYTNKVTKEYYAPINLGATDASPTLPTYTYRSVAPISPESWIGWYQATRGAGYAERVLKVNSADLQSNYIVGNDLVRIANSWYTDTTNPSLCSMLHNGLCHWHGVLYTYDGSTSVVNDWYSLFYVTPEGKISPKTWHSLEDPVGGSSRNPNIEDNAFDGRIIVSWERANASNERTVIMYVPICVGIADQDYIAGDIVRPLIRGRIRGMSSLVSHLPKGVHMGWSLGSGEVRPYGAAMIPVGRLISDDIFEVDVPMRGYPYQSIDQRLS